MGKAKYWQFVDKSIASILSAIEVYNKPDFKFREESFSILLVNGWELLLKAKLIKENRGRVECIFVKTNAVNIHGKKLKRLVYKYNRSYNRMTMGLQKCINILASKNILNNSIKSNIEALIEVRDNAVHFCLDNDTICLKINELGTASLKNYFNCIKEWFDMDLSRYNLFIFPLTFKHKYEFESYSISNKNEQVQNFLSYIENIEHEYPSNEDDDYNVTLKMRLTYAKATSSSSISVTNSNDPTAIKVTFNEEELRERYPLSYDEVRNKCSLRYKDFKQNKEFYGIMRQIKKNKNLAYNRKLDPSNNKSSSKWFYNGNIFRELDKHYSKSK